MTEQRLERIIANLAELSPEELDVIADKIVEKRNELREAKKQKFLNQITELITEAREDGIYFYHMDDEIWEHNISIVSLK